MSDVGAVEPLAVLGRDLCVVQTEALQGNAGFMPIVLILPIVPIMAHCAHYGPLCPLCAHCAHCGPLCPLCPLWPIVPIVVCCGMLPVVFVYTPHPAFYMNNMRRASEPPALAVKRVAVWLGLWLVGQAQWHWMGQRARSTSCCCCCHWMRCNPSRWVVETVPTKPDADNPKISMDVQVLPPPAGMMG
jgi:hypothetical protein